ncbi:uncharacterized protein (TIGR01777 family) [Arcanobacterium pluranimalium]|uniref:TIGR01777 family oxidoreductase n=1 Tax=Arcanobacterium pluranimalium TaxID=108028 RepID=UPI00195E1B9E|nr:TIGR01777 family oxidoreductase [Arcanobacterium pluranimalium]MBM7825563.1 uncharacterized protein (TIGR01777 family) [Arcanobacterium pluranimalium]
MSDKSVLLVAGSSGFIGSAFVKSALCRYSQVRCLTRNSQGHVPQEGSRLPVRWDPGQGMIDPQAIAGANVAVCLNGAHINRMWTKKYRETLWQSRISSVRTLVDGIAKVPEQQRPRVLLSGSAVGYYGYDADQPVSEDTPVGNGFLSELCQAWEYEANRAREYGVRVVNIRTGLVMHPSGGLLKAMTALFKLGLGAKIGSGAAWMPVISLQDYIRAIHFCIEHSQIFGPVNFCAPHPVRNAQWTEHMADFVRRPAILTVPKSIIRCGLGQMGRETILASQQVVPDVLLKNGFVFESTNSMEIFSSFQEKHSEK